MSKFLLQPVSPFHINQCFGADQACTNGVKTVFKEQNAVCPTGYQSLYGKFGMKGHNALDLSAYTGQAVVASHNGFIEEVQTEEARGLGLGIISDFKSFFTETGKEEYFKTRYWHLKGFLVNKGDYVKAGEIIAYADNTGYSSGSHLHFECKPVEVTLDIGRPKIVQNILQTNGYNGAIDPLPYTGTEKELQIDLLSTLIKLMKSILTFTKA